MAKKDDKDPEIRRGKKFKKAVPVGLTEDEINEKQRKIRENLTVMVNLDEDMKPFKDKKAAAKADNDKLRLECEEKKEDREVYVYNEFHFKQNKVIMKRLDGDEEVETRVMTEEERQEEFGDLLRASGDDEGDGPASVN